MERNENFGVDSINDLAIHLAWAQVEIFADEIERVQVLAAGDESSVKDLRIEVEDNVLVVEQPQYGLSLNITESHWMQVCVRVPADWSQKIHVNTISGLLNARGLNGSRIVLDTVSGDIRANRLTAGEISIKSISGDLRSEGLTAERLTARTVSGNIALDNSSAKSYRCTTVSGEQRIKLRDSFEMMDLRSVSGDVTLMTSVRRMSISSRSLNGRISADNVEMTNEPGVPVVRVTGVSADLRVIGATE